MHLGPEYGNRGWGKSSANGLLFMQTMNRCGMVVADMNESCDGP